ncbi:hypothetical protein Cgig2_027171 [Carnegiea gigantea]|uniref:Uncharacterized protein n=1 Tax=Carnegiea gigantea TaxID=171969 RepID=A0A9Q1KUI8_9CARY|nr:hypothetical protein Cgig2_027171 [Carnegiea gigantea]
MSLRPALLRLPRDVPAGQLTEHIGIAYGIHREPSPIPRGYRRRVEPLSHRVIQPSMLRTLSRFTPRESTSTMLRLTQLQPRAIPHDPVTNKGLAIPFILNGVDPFVISLIMSSSQSKQLTWIIVLLNIIWEMDCVPRTVAAILGSSCVMALLYHVSHLLRHPVPSTSCCVSSSSVAVPSTASTTSSSRALPRFDKDALIP